jgi:hypothetical protein
MRNERHRENAALIWDHGAWVDSVGRCYALVIEVFVGRGPGSIPLVEKRAFYIELMKTGISNSEACRRVGVARKVLLCAIPNVLSPY